MIQKSFLIAAIFALFFASCQKEDGFKTEVKAGEENPQIKMLDQMLYFEDETQFHATIQTLLKKKSTELDVWEKEIGFTSLRSFHNNLSEELENIQKKEQFFQFLDKNKGYFEVILNEKNEPEIKTIVEGIVLPTIANKDGLFRIGNKISKITKHFLITSDIQNYNELLEFTDEKASQTKNNTTFIINKRLINVSEIYNTKANCGDGAEANVIDDKRKVNLSINLYNEGIGDVYTFYSGIKVRGYKKVFGVWFAYKTDLTLYNSSFKVTYPTSGTNGQITYAEKVFNVSGRTEEDTKELVAATFIISFYYAGNFDFYFNNYLCKASSRGVSPNIVTLSCGF